MRRFALLVLAAVLLSPEFLSSSAHAQTRLWISSTGDNTKNCSRSDPCKTFASALGKASTGSQINCLDSGPFSNFEVTKAIIITCEGVIAGFRSGGVVVNAGPDDTVILRGLSVNGEGAGTAGIKFNSGKSLIVENSTVFGIGGTNGLGIAFNPTGASFLTIINTTIANNGSASGGGGVQLSPASGGFGLVQLENVRIVSNYIGIGGGGVSTVNAVVNNSTISNNRNVGVGVSGGVNLSLVNSVISGSGGAATSGNVVSFGNNAIRNNSPDTFPSTVPLR